MVEFAPADNPYVQLLAGNVPPRPPLYCPGPPTPGFVANYRTQSNVTSPPVLVGEDDFLVPQLLGFDAISLWEFRSPEKKPIPLENGVLIDAWGRKRRNKWYLNEGILTSSQAWDDWIEAGFFAYPAEEQFIALRDLLGSLSQGPLEGMAFDASIAGAFEKAWQSMGFSHFARALRKGDELIGEALDHLLQFSAGMVDRWVDLVGVHSFILTDDMGYKGRPLVRPAEWAKWLLPRYQAFNERLHSMGCKVILHSDGQIEPLIPLIIEAGFDAIQALEPAAGVDMCRVMEQVGNKIVLIGNLDVSHLLIYGTPQEVARATTDILECALTSDARVAISPCQQIDEYCDPNNIIAMCNTAKNFQF